MGRILITGAAGFLGSQIAHHFVTQGWSVTGIDRTIPSQKPSWPLENFAFNAPDFSAFLKDFSPDAVVHAAGGASVGASVEHPAQDFANGPQLTMTVLNALRNAGLAPKVIFLSSAAVYGQPDKLPVSEQTPCSPLSPYGYHKKISESLCREFFELYGIPSASLRIFSAYGAGLKKQVVWDLCRKVAAGGEVILQGTGHETRDFIHAKDVSRAVEVVLERGELRGGIYNVASGTETSIRELAQEILAAMRADATLKFDGKVPEGNPLNWRADISRLSSLGFSPSVSLKQGIAEIVANENRSR
jgi:UDP-glucose 4-epimerase